MYELQIQLSSCFSCFLVMWIKMNLLP